MQLSDLYMATNNQTAEPQLALSWRDFRAGDSRLSFIFVGPFSRARETRSVFAKLLHLTDGIVCDLSGDATRRSFIDSESLLMFPASPCLCSVDLIFNCSFEIAPNRESFNCKLSRFSFD